MEIVEVQWQWMYAGAAWIIVALAVWWLFSPKSWVKYVPDWVEGTLILYGTVEALWGVSQVYGLVPSRHSLFALTGSFYNPGPYSGFLALVFPLCLHAWLLRRNRKKTIPYYIVLFAMLCMLCVLPAGMSRSAWLAAAISSAYIGGMHYRERVKSVLKRYGIWIAIVCLLALSGIYLLKKDSADGRLFMWKIAAQAVCERPLTGYGWDYVAGAYGQAQEHYFATGRYTWQEEHVAGSPEYVFNEYLQVALAWGIPALVGGMLLLGAGMYIGHWQKCYGICGALLSFSVFAFSSYPLQFPLFVGSVVLLLLVCGLSAWAGQPMRYRMVPALFLGGGAVACWSGYVQQKHQVQAFRTWSQSRMLYQSGAYAQVVEKEAALYEALKRNARFLFEYGHALHKLHEPERSNEVLKEALRVSSDPMILNIMGKNEQLLAHYGEAEQYFLRATHRLPGRIYPYFLLANLYAVPAFYQPEKLKQMVQLVLEKEPKVQSTAIQQMRQQAKNLLKEKEIVK